MHCLVFRMEGKGMMERNDSQKFLVACCVSLIGGAGGLQGSCAVISVVIAIVIVIVIVFVIVIVIAIIIVVIVIVIIIIFVVIIASTIARQRRGYVQKQ